MGYSLKTLLHVVYPPLCFHCDGGRTEGRHLLCSECLRHLELLQSSNRCLFCFKEIEGRKVCSECLRFPIEYTRHAATCDSIGPAASFSHLFSQGKYFLSSAMGSLMGMQLLSLDWPVPDLIIPLPEKSPTELLAREIAQILQRPVEKALTYRIDFSLWADPQSRRWCKVDVKRGVRDALADKRILLISTRFDQARVQEAALVLSAQFPKSIYSLSFV